MSVGDKDLFRCHECGHSIITVERADGRPPLVLPCLGEGCDNVMLSTDGKADVLGRKATYELRFPTGAEYEQMSDRYQEKVDNKNLLPFRIDRSSQDNSSTAIIDHMRRPRI